MSKSTKFILGTVVTLVILSVSFATWTIRRSVESGIRPFEHSPVRTLRSALAAAQAVYDATILPGDKSNFATQAPDSNGQISGGTAATYHRAHDDIVVDALKMEEPGITFQSKSDYGSIASHPGSPDTAWVQINGTSTSPAAIIPPGELGINPNGYANNPREITTDLVIQPAQLIRMGVKATSGNSFCVIVVADSSTGQVTGTGYQTVSAEHTQAGFGADCGAEETDQNKWREMPNTPGTDIILTSHLSPITPEGAQETPPNSLYAGTDVLND